MKQILKLAMSIVVCAGFLSQSNALAFSFGSNKTYTIQEMQNFIQAQLEAVCPEDDTKLTAPITTLTFADNGNNSFNHFIVNSKDYVDDNITLKHPCYAKLISFMVHNICEKYVREKTYVHLPAPYNYNAIPVMEGPSTIQMLSVKSFNCDEISGNY